MISKQRKALILGSEGQDGYFLKRLLLRENYSLCCTVKNAEKKALFKSSDGLKIEVLNISDTESFTRIFQDFQPDEIYNLAGMSSVGSSFKYPDLCMESNFNSVERMLNFLRDTGSKSKFYQSSSSEIFGNLMTSANENSDLNPISPYGKAKSMAHQLCIKYRLEFGLNVSTGILFNHESERRSKTFVSRKITSSVAAIKRGEISNFSLGNILISRDWGYAPDYVRAMHLILQSAPADYVVATGVSRTLEDFIITALRVAGLNGKIEDYVKMDNALKRETDLFTSVGDATKIRDELGWFAETKFEKMIEIMVANDLLNMDDER